MDSGIVFTPEIVCNYVVSEVSDESSCYEQDIDTVGPSATVPGILLGGAQTLPSARQAQCTSG